MNEALREWKFNRLQQEIAEEELGIEWDIGIASRKAGNAQQAFARIRARLEDKQF